MFRHQSLRKTDVQIFKIDRKDCKETERERERERKKVQEEGKKLKESVCVCLGDREIEVDEIPL